MSKRSITLEIDRPLARLTLRRGRIDLSAVADLAAACESLEADEAVRAVVLTAEGGDFCPGWDASVLSGEGPSLPTDPFGPLAELSRPVVCAVRGEAGSAGLEIALACDIRIAADDARFSLPEVSMGLLPLAGGTQRLPRLVGRGKALHMILTGESIDAAEALAIGLVNSVVPPDRLAAEADAIARRIAERGPLAVRYAKEAISRGLDMTLEQALRYETDLTVILQTTEDRAEGVRAFLEKRKPEFKGR